MAGRSTACGQPGRLWTDQEAAAFEDDAPAELDEELDDEEAEEDEELDEDEESEDDELDDELSDFADSDEAPTRCSPSPSGSRCGRSRCP